MTKFADKSFTVACLSGGISAAEAEARWLATFGKRAQDAPAPRLGAQAGLAVDSGRAAVCACPGANLDADPALDMAGIEMMPLEEAD